MKNNSWDFEHRYGPKRSKADSKLRDLPSLIGEMQKWGHAHSTKKGAQKSGKWTFVLKVIITISFIRTIS